MAYKEEIMALIDDTEKKLSAFLMQMEAGQSFDMTGFEQLAVTIQQKIAELPKQDALGFREDVERLLKMLDKLAQGLEIKRASVRQEIESLNRQLSANQAYRKTDSTSSNT